MTLGSKIKNKNVSLGLTQKQLAGGICTQSKISKIEKNEVMPLANLLFDISKRLNTSIDVLMYSKNNKSNEISIQINIQKLLLQRNYLKIADLIKTLDKSDWSYKGEVFLEWIDIILESKLQNNSVINKLIDLYEIHKDFIDAEMKVNILNSIGISYKNEKDFNNAKVFLKAKKISSQDILNNNLRLKVLYNLTNILFELSEWRSLYDNSLEALRLSYEFNSIIVLPELIYSKNYTVFKSSLTQDS